MAKKLKYHFNPQDLKFVIHTPKSGEGFLKAAGIFAASFLLVLVFYGYSQRQAANPGERKLRQQIQLYEREVARMNVQLASLNTKLGELESRDKEIYKVVFAAEPEEAGSDSVQLNKELAEVGGNLLAATDQKLSQAALRASAMARTYAELQKLARSKERFLASLPAIQPISNKNLKQIASGFGHRLHPVYKQMQMHTGLDFTAETGTPIYATGDGVVQGKDPNGGGYGNHVVINHGFGYQTLYGHMSKVLVRAGQKVKRGQLIGRVGSTGISTAPHLHYEVILKGKKIDPIHFFHNDLNARQYAQLIDLANRSRQSFD